MIKYSDNSDVWDCFDTFYCISIEERFDRRQEAEKQFASIGLKNRVEFFIVKKHPEDTEQGIFESHIRCIEKGLARQADSIVIFEDDILFERFDVSRLRQSIKFLSSCRDWNILFFGCLATKSTATDCETVLRIRYKSLTHAYVISSNFAQVVRQQEWNGVSYDEMLRNIQRNYFTVSPQFAFQSNSITNNDKYLHLDRFRRMIGGLRRIQKRNEFYHLNRAVVIAIHVVVVCLFIGLLLLSFSG